MRTSPLFRFLALAAAIGLSIMLLAAAGCGTDQSTSTVITNTATTIVSPPPTPEGGLTAGVAAVSAQVKPAVVQITNNQTQQGQFSQVTVPAGVGSGVIYDSQGHILTNEHVIEGAQSLLVTLPDGRSFDGNLVGSDVQTDMAVVQITGDNLPVATLGDAQQLQVGEWVVAIGNALALPGGPTVTTGVVSALGRAVQEPGNTPNTQGPFLFSLIQTDAPINPGNSGGPLINLAGQVVGINTLVAGSDQSGNTAQGIGFAISINAAKQTADALVANGKVVHPYLGISYQPLDPVLANQLNVPVNTGVFVVQVVPGSPAADDGLQANDVITQADGKQLTSDSDLAAIINGKHPGDKINLTVLRNGKNVNVTVTLGTMPGS